MTVVGVALVAGLRFGPAVVVRASPVAVVRAGLAARVPGPAAGAADRADGALMRRASLADSQPIPASSRNRPANTAPCALNGPAPPSQWLPSGAPNRPWLSSVFGAPAMRGDRNSRYRTLRT